MKHIQTCARKNKLEDDTVIALIRVELARTLESGQPTSTSTSKAPGAEVAATLLENVVQEGPKKKGRRPKVVESVKQLADTRESILERARLLLQSQPPAGPSKSKAPPSAASTSVTPPLPPATQTFGESALAQKYQSKSKAFPDPTQPPARVPSPPMASGPSPPASPTFGESNLAKQFHVQAKAFYTSYPERNSSSSPVYIPSPLAQRNQGSDPPVLLSPSPTPRRLQGDGDHQLVLGRDNPQKAKGRGRGKRRKLLLARRNSDAVPLAKPPILPLAKPSPPRSSSPTKKSKGTTTRKPRSKKSAAGDVHVDDPTETTSKTKSKGKSKSIQLTDDELFAKLRESILQDRELYLRILRYEPVHFDVFLKLAGDTGVSDRGLKLRVRAFLDKQAIHFYGLVVSRSRTKKRRA
ncbi:hypothetical protein BC629DRAFT_1553962 [Irpex lacteus]|nr:hypothetical protein BC629DRAFT_1553962 [Irpex lacteus]